ncbi:MAG: hypothetical protein Ct9H300mP11_02180 [Chloroflexota bacterium]|nr:MAG: hypothetical protein Ct9H300mP11_02180 [Chloroflexota bacterium]
MKLGNFVVGKDAALGKPGEGYHTGVTQGFGFGFAATYIGAAQTALDFTKGNFFINQTFAPNAGRVADGLIVQRSMQKWQRH